MVEKDDCESWNFAQRLIRHCYSDDFKTISFTAAHFRVQISPKYLHSLEPQNHITLNSSLIFEIFPSTSLLKFLLTLQLMLPLFNLSPNIKSES